MGAEFGSDKKLSKNSDKKITKFLAKLWRKCEFSSLYNIIYLEKEGKCCSRDAFRGRKKQAFWKKMAFVHFDEWFERKFLAIQEKFEIFAKKSCLFANLSKIIDEERKI